MSLRRKRRRKHEQRRHHETQPTRRRAPAGDVREVDDARLLRGWALDALNELEGVYGSAPWAPSEDARDVDEAGPTVRSSSRGLQEAGEIERLAYTRRQAAEALGVSISTIDRRVVPSITTVKLPWGQRLIPVDGLERFMRNHVASARRRPARRSPGRPRTLPRSVVERIRLEYARGRSRPRSRARSRRRVSRRRTVAGSGGRRRCARFSAGHETFGREPVAPSREGSRASARARRARNCGTSTSPKSRSPNKALMCR